MKIFSLCLILLFMPYASLKAQKNKSPIKIGFHDWIGFYPIYLANEKGYFGKKDEKIKLSNSQIGQNGIASLVSGKLDCYATAITESLAAISQGSDVRLVVMTSYSNGADMMIADKSIKSVMDLKGKLVGTEPGTISHAFLMLALQDAGMKAKDIRLSGSTLQEASQRFVDKKIDAIVSFPPHSRPATDDPRSHVLTTSASYPGRITDHILCRESAIKQRPEMIQTLVDGFFRAVEDIKKDQDSSLKVIEKAIEGRQSLADLKGDLTVAVLGSKKENQAWVGKSKELIPFWAEFIKKNKIGNRIKKSKKILAKEFVKNSKY